MYEFLDRLIHVALPRVRDFKGVSDRSFDGRGNYSLGLREQIIFPEIVADKVEKTRGMTVSFVTNAKTDQRRQNPAQVAGYAFCQLIDEGDFHWPRHVFELRQKDRISSKYGNIIAARFVVERGRFIGVSACAGCVCEITHARDIFPD